MRTAISFLIVAVATLLSITSYAQDKYVVEPDSRAIWQIAFKHNLPCGDVWGWNVNKIDLVRAMKLEGDSDRYDYEFNVGDTLVIPQDDIDWDVVYPYSWTRTKFQPAEWLVSFYNPSPFRRAVGDTMVQVNYYRNQVVTVVIVQIYTVPGEYDVYIMNGKVRWTKKISVMQGVNLGTPAQRYERELYPAEFWLAGYYLYKAGLDHLPEYIRREVEKAGFALCPTR